MNPHYAAWVAVTGGGPNWEFMVWIWEQKKLWLTHCVSPDGSTALSFTEWLANQAKQK